MLITDLKTKFLIIPYNLSFMRNKIQSYDFKV